MTTPTNKKPTDGPSVRVPERLFFRIGDVARLLEVKPHVLRYWESEFPIISPQKSISGQRVYRRTDVETLVMVKHLLHDARYSIEGARRRIRELRKEGQLKSFKEEVVTAPETTEPSPSPTPTTMTVGAEARDAIQALAEFARKPISELFHFA